MLSSWYNFSIAILAIATCFVFIPTSAAFLARTVMRTTPLNPHWRLALSWFLVIPWYGTWFMAAGLAGVGSRALCLTLVSTTVLVGSFCLWKSRRDWQTLRQLGGELDRRTKILGATMVAIWAIYLISAAHPQLKYDQFNYHLVIAKKLISNGSPFLHNLDQATILAGVLEYGYAAFYAILPDELFLTAASQAAATVTFFPLFLFSFAWLERRVMEKPHLAWTFSFAIALLAMFPEAGLFGMTKPAPWVMAGSLLMFAAMSLPPPSWIFVHLVMICVLAAAKTSALVLGTIPICALACACFSPVSGVVQGFGSSLINPTTMFALSGLGLALLKNGWYSGNPIFPVSNPLFATSENLLGVSRFFAEIRLADQSALTRALGPILALKKAWLVAVIIGFSGAAYAIGRGRLPKNRRPFWTLAAFILLFSGLWPVFYQNEIYIRFVAFYYTALILLCFYLCSGVTFPKVRGRGPAIIATVCLFFSHLDVMIANIVRLNQGTADSVMARQHWSYEAARYLNQRMAPDDIVISDDPAKLFYRGTLVCTCGGGSTALEHQIAENVRKKSNQTAGRTVSALARQRGTPGPLPEIWENPKAEGSQHIVLEHSEILLLPHESRGKPSS